MGWNTAQASSVTPGAGNPKYSSEFESTPTFLSWGNFQRLEGSGTAQHLGTPRCLAGCGTAQHLGTPRCLEGSGTPDRRIAGQGKGCTEGVPDRAWAGQKVCRTDGVPDRASVRQGDCQTGRVWDSGVEMSDRRQPDRVCAGLDE